MPRWDYDTVFYRVSCVALLAVAFTFTIILTNVFIDIDGMLFDKNKDKPKRNQETVQAEDLMAQEDDYMDVYDSYDAERTKRSLETQDFSFHTKDPKIKKVITRRIVELLDELDHEIPTNANKNDKHEQDNKLIIENNKKTNDMNDKYSEIDTMSDRYKYKPNIDVNRNKEVLTKVMETDHLGQSREELNDNKISNDIERPKEAVKMQNYDTEEELKHLAIHNIILQGIIGHMDLGDVYARVHALISNLEKYPAKTDCLKDILYPAQDKKFFDELINCKQLKDEIVIKSARKEMQSIQKTTLKPPGRNVMIKTIIDITSLTNDKTNQDASMSKENVNGIFKLIYNGKSFKFKKVEENPSAAKTISTQANESEPAKGIDNSSNLNIFLDRITKNNIHDIVPKMNSILKDFLQRYSQDTESQENTKKTATKRLKRHIKIQYDNEETTTAISKVKEKDDDELFVEIETHFDSKGMKGEKKKKVIRDLIEKIQKAIHSDQEVKKKKNKLHLHVKKRMQHPLDSKSDNTFLNKIPMPLDNLVHRDLEPISKSVPLHEKLPYVSDNKGDDWKRDYYGPRFLTVSKAINSAEMDEVDTDYNKVMNDGIPQRLQKPLNTDSDNEMIVTNVNSPGDVKYLVKNIAGSGFSIGFNQYVDEAPDAESMKLFTGIENIIKTYHQQYDTTDADNADTDTKYADMNPEHSEPQINEHVILRRSIQSEQDHHSNEYKVIFNKNFLNYENYQDVYNKSIDKKTGMKRLFLDDILDKNLNPAEIFILANLLERKKRSLKIKKNSNIKKKLNRYINTKAMATKNIFLQKKRAKRQINKIRIIAKDLSKHHNHNSEEDIFVLSSDEKIFADRAIIKEVETPTLEFSDKMNVEHFDVISPQKPSKRNLNIISPQTVHEEHFDLISPQVTENHYDIISPYIFETPSQEKSYRGSNIFTRRSRHDSLMSKYPHIIMEERSNSKEDLNMPDSSLIYGKVLENFPVNADAIVTTQVTPHTVEVQPENKIISTPKYTIPNLNNIPQNKYDIPDNTFDNPEIQEIFDSLPPSPQDKSNYRVTVKIMPKNNANLNSGFKEIHTSINKSYDKNGLKYTSMINVSEISKVEKLNKTKDHYELNHPTVNKLKREHKKIQSLIKQHKDRIEEQLAHLHREKEKIERIDVKNAELVLKDNYIGAPLLNNPERSQHITDEDLKSLPIITTTQKPATISTTIEYVGPTTEDPEKIKIIKTIERNEKITTEILKKIDKNTDILQTFLQKLIKQMEMTTTQKPAEVNIRNHDRNIQSDIKNNEENQLKDTYPKVPRSNDIYDQIPNLFFSPTPKQAIRNGTVGIPFIYAFQQPYKLPNNKNTPIASVVYHGHVHANTVNTVNNQKEDIQMNNRHFMKEKEAALMKEKQDVWKPGFTKPVMQNVNVVKNHTKFFIDELENDFKVLPAVGKSVYPRGTNSTKV